MSNPYNLLNGVLAAIENNLKNHITNVLTHYHGRIHSWDVVNSAVRDDLSAADAAGD